MPTNSTITRSGAPRPPEDLVAEIAQTAVEESAVLSLGRRLRDMTRDQMRLRVMDALPTAYFVTGDTGLKQTSDMSWRNVTITAEELAVIVPVPENVLDDNDIDIWSEVKPRIAEAIGKAVDAAVLFGTNAPSTWPTNITAAATAASNDVTLSSGDLYDKLFAASGVVDKVETDGYFVTGYAAAIAMRAKLRGYRINEGGGAGTGHPLFLNDPTSNIRYTLDGEPLYFPRNGAFDAATALLFAGDWSQLVYSIRKDIDFKVGTEAVIQDGSGNIVLNTFQQDAVALRATFRMGWAVPNPENLIQPTDASRYPFAVLKP